MMTTNRARRVEPIDAPSDITSHYERLLWAQGWNAAIDAQEPPAQLRVAVVIFSSDAAEMRLRSALACARRGEAEAAAEWLVGAVREDSIDLASSYPVVTR